MSDRRVRPTLLIGLGGSGCRIAESVYREAKQTDAGRDNSIRVIGLDTDVNDMSRLSAIADNERLRFSTPESIGEIVDRERAAVESFFVDPATLPVKVRNMKLVDGAGQVRMFTHLALFTAFKAAELQQQMGNALSGLMQFDGRPRVGEVANVVLVGSLAGATGSGSFVQIALMLHQLAAQKRIAMDVRGIFLLPDVFVNAANVPADQRRNVMANGYAALKELNAVNLVANGKAGDFDFIYEFAPGQFSTHGVPPFQSLTLIDFETSRGGSLGPDIDRYNELTARIVYQQIFSPIGGKIRSVEVNDVRSKLAAAARSADDMYSGIGVSAAAYPAEAIADYLTTRFVLANLTGDWIRLDRQFADRKRRYDEQRAQGNLTQREPDLPTTYLEDLTALATQEKHAFFADIHEKLNPVVEEPGKLPTPRPVATTYLDALVGHVRQGFWSSAGLEEVKKRPRISVENLNDRETLPDSVLKLEQILNRDWALVEEKSRDRPSEILTNTLTSADDMGPIDWQDHHIQKHIIKGGPHLVFVRALLYALNKEVEERLAKIDPQTQKERLFKLSGQFEDEPERNRAQRGSQKVMERARDAVGKSFGGKSARRAFAEQYETYYNSSLDRMRNYGDAMLERRVLEDIRREIEMLLSVITGLFGEITALAERLRAEAADKERHHDKSHDGAGNVWVNADADAKQAIWAELELRSAGARHDADMNLAIVQAVYQKYRADRRARAETSFDELRRIFRETVIERFGKGRVEDEFRSVYDLTIVQAVRAEAKRQGRDWRERFRELVTVVSEQSEPYLSLIDEQSHGQRIAYWAIHPRVEEEIADPAEFSQLFTGGSGESPLVEPEFNPREILRVNTRVNLELTHLAKLRPGAAAGPAHLMKGRYFEHYEDMVSKLIASDPAKTGNDAGEFTPHIHRDWHLPGVLPEIDPNVSSRHLDRAHRAYALAIGMGVLERKELYGKLILMFSTSEKRRFGGKTVELFQFAGDGADMLPALKAFERRADLVDEALAYWDEALTQRVGLDGAPVDDFHQIGAVVKIASGGTLRQFLQLAAVRSDEGARDRRTASVVAGWASVVSDLVRAFQSDVDARAREMPGGRVDDLVGNAKQEAFAAGFNATPETELKITQAFNDGLGLYRSSVQHLH